MPKPYLDAVVVLTRDEIRSAMREGRTTLDIAGVLQVRESDVWNALAMSERVPTTRGYVVLRQPQRESA